MKRTRYYIVMYDIIVKGGTLIDPAQGMHEPRDIALLGGRVAAVEPSLPRSAKLVLEAEGLVVMPGLVDLHTHVCRDISYIGVDPETYCLRMGTTTVLDVGSVGHLQFKGFRSYVVDACKISIYALLNIESLGMIEFGLREQWPKLIDGLDEVFTPLFVNTEETVRTIRGNPDVILGVKWAHHGLRGLQLAREVADRIECPLMSENHFQPEPLRYLKKGDIMTHLFHSYKPRPHDGLLDEDMRVQPEFFDAARRGVVMDVGHGASAFCWQVAERALKEGLRPDTISTDLHIGSRTDLPTVMAKFLCLGLSLDEVVRASVTKPAEVLGKLGEIGTLKPNASADLVLFRLEEGKFPLSDGLGQERIGVKRLVPLTVIKGGEVCRIS